MASHGSTGLRVAFLHPDLGLGGAERLVVDAAVELVEHGHTVDLYTAYYDPRRQEQGSVGVLGGGPHSRKHLPRSVHWAG